MASVSQQPNDITIIILLHYVMENL